MPLPPFDPLSEEFRQDPYALYRTYREEEPVHLGRPRQPGQDACWYVFRHADVTKLLKDVRLGRGDLDKNREAAEPELRHFKSLLHMDPPDHTRLRRLVSKAFTASAVDAVLPRVRALADEFLDELGGRRELDLIADFAFPLPVTVIGELLGVPVEERAQLREWSRAVAAGIDATSTAETFVAARQASVAMGEYVAAALDDHRRHPREDLLSALIAARDEGDRLSEDELIALTILLIAAGHETTVNLIGNGMLALLSHPEQLAYARAAGVSRDGVDELLRFDSPVQMASRVAMDEVSAGSHTLPRGATVVSVLGSANRDPEVFADPDRLDLSRAARAHVSFGGGIHSCLGALLARAEGRIAIEALLSRYPRMELAVESPAWRSGSAFRGLESLPVRV